MSFLNEFFEWVNWNRPWTLHPPASVSRGWEDKHEPHVHLELWIYFIDWLMDFQDSISLHNPDWPGTPSGDQTGPGTFSSLPEYWEYRHLPPRTVSWITKLNMFYHHSLVPCCCFKTGSHHVLQEGLKLFILLSWALNTGIRDADYQTQLVEWFLIASRGTEKVVGELKWGGN